MYSFIHSLYFHSILIHRVTMVIGNIYFILFVPIIARVSFNLMWLLELGTLTEIDVKLEE